MKAMIVVLLVVMGVVMGVVLYLGFVAQPAHKKTKVSQTPPTAKPMLSGVVVETMDSGGYTYVQIDTGKGKVWAAGPQLVLKVGENVSVSQGMEMPNYHSKTLNRTFDKIYFVGQILKAGQKAASPAADMPSLGQLPKGHPTLGAASGNGTKSAIIVGKIQKADGGKTIAELFAQRTALAGKPISIRGKVVKYLPMILGKNWIHIQDGSGGKGTNDLTVTTSGKASVGDTVLIQGKVTLNKDFGAGYKYTLIIEDAAVTVEK